jgi:1,4-dihydroxy-2-naphthoyl-CoA hydrolase
MKVTGAIEFRITERTDECVSGEMPVKPGILNPSGVAHAGAMLWFADACASALGAGRTEFAPCARDFPFGMILSANFEGSQGDGVFRARSTFVKRGRRLSVVRTVITGNDGQVFADITTSHLPAR